MKENTLNKVIEDAIKKAKNLESLSGMTLFEQTSIILLSEILINSKEISGIKGQLFGEFSNLSREIRGIRSAQTRL